MIELEVLKSNPRVLGAAAGQLGGLDLGQHPQVRGPIGDVGRDSFKETRSRSNSKGPQGKILG